MGAVVPRIERHRHPVVTSMARHQPRCRRQSSRIRIRLHGCRQGGQRALPRFRPRTLAPRELPTRAGLPPPQDFRALNWAKRRLWNTVVRIIKGRAADCCAISTARSRAAITTNLARSSLTLVFCNFVMIRPNDRLGGHHPTMKNFTCDSRPSHGLVPGGRPGEFERLAESTSLPRVKTPNQSRMSSTANGSVQSVLWR